MNREEEMMRVMRNLKMTVGAVGAVAVATVVLVGGCTPKASEPFRDAPRSDVEDDSPADVIFMPDGFSNLATKCDVHGNRVYVMYKADDTTRGSIFVVPQDPTCAGG